MYGAALMGLAVSITTTNLHRHQNALRISVDSLHFALPKGVLCLTFAFS